VFVLLAWYVKPNQEGISSTAQGFRASMCETTWVPDNGNLAGNGTVACGLDKEENLLIITPVAQEQVSVSFCRRQGSKRPYF
jgi:hypothetical protein